MNETAMPPDRSQHVDADALKAALLDSEARHRIISGLISDYAYSMRIEPDGSMTREWHAGNFSAITGYSDDELDRSDIWADLIHPDDWQIILERLNALREGRTIVSEYRILTAAGKLCWLRDYGQPIVDNSGRLIRVYGALQDITVQKLADEQLRRSEEEYRSIFELAGTAKAQADPHTGRLLRVNQRLSDMLGYTREELLGMHINQLTHPDDHAVDAETYRQLIVEGGTHRSFDKRYLHKNGTTIWAHLELTVVRDVNGTPLHYAASILDITQRRMDEERIRFQALLLNAVQQAVIATDINGTILFWNRYAEALYGWPAEETLGKNIVEMNVSPTQIELAGEIIASLAKGAMWTGEFEVQRRDGTVFIAQVTDSPVFDEAGRAIGIIGISQDVSERRRLQGNERLLAEVGQLLVESINIEWRISRLANVLVRDFGEVCTVLLVNEMGETTHFKAAHRNPAFEADLATLSNYSPTNQRATTTWQALHTGRPIFMPLVPKEFKQKTAINAEHAMLRERLGFHSMITVPLIARGNTLGVISIARSAQLPRYHEQDFTFMLEVCRSAAQYLDNARLYEEMQTINAELELRVEQRTAELQESQSQLRMLTARLQSTREDERRRIAREVHDVIGQLLTSLKMEAGWMNMKLNDEGNPLAEHTSNMLALLDSAFSSVRQIATELRPTLLDDLGLIAAIEWQVEDFQRRSGIACQFESTLEVAPLDSDATIALFRILQEALTNVARHAGATRANVTIEEDHRGWLVLQVQDNGRGITLVEQQQTQSLGLLGMRERINLLGGEFTIHGERDHGTTLTVRVPMSRVEDNTIAG